MREDFSRLIQIAIQHTRWRGSCINLIASENVMSLSVREALASDFAHRYGSLKGLRGVTSYQSYTGTRYIVKVYNNAVYLAKKLFQAGFVDLRPLSGNIADVSVLLSLTKPGDTVLNTAYLDGGHTNYMVEGFKVSPSLQRHYTHLPFDAEGLNIDVDKACKVITAEKPRLLILGTSFMLFPQPVKELAEAAKAVEAHVAYDGAHVLGLIAGGKFQDPLREGAEILMGSTHKTFPGPQGGFIGSNTATVFRKVAGVVYPPMHDNIHYNRIYAMALTLSEMLAFGKPYARQVVANAKALAESLCKRGFRVLGENLGFTRSHIVRIDLSKEGGSIKGLKLLEKANLIASPSPVPGDRLGKPLSGLRLGTSEATRLGMKEEHMDVVAEFIESVLLRGLNPTQVSTKAASFKKGFQTVHYCFDNP